MLLFLKVSIVLHNGGIHSFISGNKVAVLIRTRLFFCDAHVTCQSSSEPGLQLSCSYSELMPRTNHLPKKTISLQRYRTMNCNSNVVGRNRSKAYCVILLAGAYFYCNFSGQNDTNLVRFRGWRSTPVESCHSNSEKVQCYRCKRA